MSTVPLFPLLFFALKNMIFFVKYVAYVNVLYIMGFYCYFKLIIIFDMANMDRFNPHKAKLSGVLDNF